MENFIKNLILSDFYADFSKKITLLCIIIKKDTIFSKKNKMSTMKKIEAIIRSSKFDDVKKSSQRYRHQLFLLYGSKGFWSAKTRASNVSWKCI